MMKHCLNFSGSLVLCSFHSSLFLDTVKILEKTNRTDVRDGYNLPV